MSRFPTSPRVPVASKAILSLDQDTDVARAVVHDAQARVVASAERATPLARPTRDREEQDPIRLATAMLDAASEAVVRAEGEGSVVAAIGIVVPRDAIVVWDLRNGEPVAPAIVGGDVRAISACRALVDAHFALAVRHRTGRAIDPRLGAARLAWMLDHDARLRARAEAGQLAFGTLDSWLVWTLTGGAEHLAGVVNAAGTGLHDLERGRWDDRLAGLFGIPPALLPTIVPTSGLVATLAAREAPLVRLASALRDPLRRFIDASPARTPILALSTARAAALAGLGCIAPGRAAAAFDDDRTTVVFNTGATALRSGTACESSIAWHCPAPHDAPDDPFGDEFLLPEFPVETWDSARGGWITTHEVVVLRHPVVLPQDPAFAYCLEGRVGHGAAGDDRALDVCDLVAHMEKDMAMRIASLAVDGRGAHDDDAMQAQADALGVPVVRGATRFASALGIAMLAGVAAGLWATLEAAAACAATGEVRVFEPAGDAAARRQRILEWRYVRSCDAARAGTTTD